MGMWSVDLVHWSPWPWQDNYGLNFILCIIYLKLTCICVGTSVEDSEEIPLDDEDDVDESTEVDDVETENEE